MFTTIPNQQSLTLSPYKAIFDVSAVDFVERSKYDMSFKHFLEMARKEGAKTKRPTRV